MAIFKSQCPPVWVFAGLLLFPTLASAAPEYPEGVHAVVKIPSHGCSGTVIATGKDASWILSCAHAFQGSDAQKPIKLLVPMKGVAPEARGKPKLIAVQLDETKGIDLSLIYLPAGPLPYVAPVSEATTGLDKGQRYWSVGYDEMRATSVKVATQVLGADRVTYTRERPVPGRSGGALLTSQGRLVGVVIGYEVRPQGRGLYVSHATIQVWLRARSSRKPPEVREEKQPCPS